MQRNIVGRSQLQGVGMPLSMVALQTTAGIVPGIRCDTSRVVYGRPQCLRKRCTCEGGCLSMSRSIHPGCCQRCCQPARGKGAPLQGILAYSAVKKSVPHGSGCEDSLGGVRQGMVMRWRQGVTFSGAIAVCRECADPFSPCVAGHPIVLRAADRPYARAR